MYSAQQSIVHGCISINEKYKRTGSFVLQRVLLLLAAWRWATLLFLDYNANIVANKTSSSSINTVQYSTTARVIV